MHRHVNTSIHTYAHRYIDTETHTYINAWIDRYADREIGRREVAWSSEEVQASFSSEYKSLWRKDEPSFCYSLLQSIAVCCSHHKTRLFDAKMSLLSVTVCCSLLQSIAVCCSHHKTRLFDAKMSLLSKKHTTRSHVSYFIFFREKLICNILPRMYHIFCLSRKRTTLELQCESTVPQSPCGKRTPPDLWLPNLHWDNRNQNATFLIFLFFGFQLFSPLLERGHGATLLGFVLWIQNIHVMPLTLILAIQMLQCVAECCMRRIAMYSCKSAHMHACYPTSSSGMQYGEEESRGVLQSVARDA